MAARRGVTMGNSVKTVLLLGALTGLLVVVGGSLGGRNGMILGLLFAALMNFGSYWFSDRIVLAMYRAKPVLEEDAPRLHAMVEEVAARAGVPKPRVCLIPSPAPNAFATGRNPSKAVVAVTSGILQLLDDEELEGVLAHEIGHIRNRDILIGSIAATLAGAIMVAARLAWFIPIGGGRGDRGGNPLGALLSLILAPIAALLIQMAVSRSREYKADESAARWAGPTGLANALRKLHAASRRAPMPATTNTAHLFIVKPAVGGLLANLFSTHPPIEKRVERLLRAV
jgi:heat shock protein HtpX